MIQVLLAFHNRQRGRQAMRHRNLPVQMSDRKTPEDTFPHTTTFFYESTVCFFHVTSLSISPVAQSGLCNGQLLLSENIWHSFNIVPEY